jgi:hypothetical protein
MFVISPDVYKLTGAVTISFIDEKDRKGFRVTSAKPVSEWGGWGLCRIRV